MTCYLAERNHNFLNSGTIVRGIPQYSHDVALDKKEVARIASVSMVPPIVQGGDPGVLPGISTS